MVATNTLRHIVEELVVAWNSHNVGRILAHYSEDLVLSSPLVTKLTGEESGTLHGRNAFEVFVKKLLGMHPDLRFNLREVYCGVGLVTIVYEDTHGKRAAQTILFDRKGHIRQVFVTYASACEEKAGSDAGSL